MKPGYETKRQEWNPEEQEGELEVVLQRGGFVEGIVMDLERAEPVTAFTVSGMDRVMTGAGEPGKYNPFSGGTTFEDPAGRFRLEGVEPGEVDLGSDLGVAVIGDGDLEFCLLPRRQLGEVRV